jgi:hypothetical protein
MGKEQSDYISYLLRVWRSNGGKTAWRASLENPHTGERIGFASLGELFVFLWQQTGVVSDSEDSREESRKEGGAY